MKTLLLRNTLLMAVAIAALIYLLKGRIAFDFPLVFGTNILMAIVTLLSGFVSSRANPDRTASFINGIYGSTLLRLFLVGGAAAVYIFMKKGVVDTRSFLMAGGIYMVYTLVETFVQQKATRKHAATAKE